MLPGGIRPSCGQKTHVAAQTGQIGSHVGGPAKSIGLALDFYDGDGSLGRYSGDPAPNVAIQHRVAYYQHPDFLKIGKIKKHHLILKYSTKALPMLSINADPAGSIPRHSRNNGVRKSSRLHERR